MFNSLKIISCAIPISQGRTANVHTNTPAMSKLFGQDNSPKVLHFEGLLPNKAAKYSEYPPLLKTLTYASIGGVLAASLATALFPALGFIFYFTLFCLVAAYFSKTPIDKALVKRLKTAAKQVPLNLFLNKVKADKGLYAQAKDHVYKFQYNSGDHLELLRNLQDFPYEIDFVKIDGYIYFILGEQFETIPLPFQDGIHLHFHPSVYEHPHLPTGDDVTFARSRDGYFRNRPYFVLSQKGLTLYSGRSAGDIDIRLIKKELDKILSSFTLSRSLVHPESPAEFLEKAGFIMLPAEHLDVLWDDPDSEAFFTNLLKKKQHTRKEDWSIKKIKQANQGH